MSEIANALRQLDKSAGLGGLSGSEIVAAAGLLKHELLRGGIKKLAGEGGLEIYDDLTQKAGEGLSAFEAHLNKRIEETGRENGYSDQEIADTKYVAGAAMKLATVIVAGKGSAGSKGTVGKAGGESSTTRGTTIYVDSRGNTLVGDWSSTKRLTSPENALGHWRKHQAEFPEYANAQHYVEGAQKFVSNPPSSILTKVRNGDTIFYDPISNTFAVKSPDGAPRTMFRPDPSKHGYPTNLDYFNDQ